MFCVDNELLFSSTKEPDVSDSEFGESQEMEQEQDDTSLDDAVAGGSSTTVRLMR